MKVFAAPFVTQHRGLTGTNRPPRSQIPTDAGAPGRTGDRHGDGTFSDGDDDITF